MPYGAEREERLARFHVQRSDGSRLAGAAAFIVTLGLRPRLRVLAKRASLSRKLRVLELA